MQKAVTISASLDTVMRLTSNLPPSGLRWVQSITEVSATSSGVAGL